MTRRSASSTSAISWSPPAGGRYAIGVLAALTDVPATSIHHYRRLGLLPEPVRVAPNRFIYDERHVVGVNLIRRLRRRGLSLDEIGAALPGLLAVGEDGVEAAIDERVKACTAEPTPGDKLIRVAIDAFAGHGFDDVSIAELCELAGIGKGTFYRYFDDKDALFIATARRVVEELGDLFAADLAGGGGQSYAAVFAHHLRHRLPILLELAKRALQDEAVIGPQAALLFGELADRLGRAVDEPDDAALAGGLLILLGVVDVFAGLVEPMLPAG